MTEDEHTTDPRCDSCRAVLPRAGAMCHVCEADAHFEGVPRTAPPITGPQRRDDDILQRTASAPGFMRIASA